MSNLLRPAGSLPPSVYWVRRLLVLLAVVLAGLVVWWLFLRPTTPTTSGQPPTAGTPTPSPSATDSSPSPTSSPSGIDAYPPCPSTAVAVTVTADKQTYRSGQDPRFTLAVQNIGNVTCRRDVGQRALELKVSSGGVSVWSSDDCSPGGPAAVRVFGPGDRFPQNVTWNRQLSAAGCPTGQPLAAPGTYQVVARSLGIVSQPVTFVLQ